MYQYLDLTDRFPLKFDISKMIEELKTLEGKDWLSHYDVALADGWTTIPLVTHDGSATSAESQRVGEWGRYKRTDYIKDLPYFNEVLDTFDCPHGRVRIMKLLPGTEIREHRDTYEEVSDYAFGQVRLHIPIITNDKVIFTVDGKNYHLEAGRLHYINFSKKHYVKNDGDQARVHLVLDLKVNDFLKNIFPPITFVQNVEMLIARTAYPLFVWTPLRLKERLKTLFWNYYNGSLLQRFRHKVLPKSN